MLRLILKLPFDVTVVLKEEYETRAEAEEKLKVLPSGFEIVENPWEDLSRAIEVPFKEKPVEK